MFKVKDQVPYSSWKFVQQLIVALQKRPFLMQCKMRCQSWEPKQNIQRGNQTTSLQVFLAEEPSFMKSWKMPLQLRHSNQGEKSSAAAWCVCLDLVIVDFMWVYLFLCVFIFLFVIIFIYVFLFFDILIWTLVISHSLSHHSWRDSAILIIKPEFWMDTLQIGSLPW